MNKREQDLALYNSIIGLVRQHFKKNGKALSNFRLYINKR